MLRKFENQNIAKFKSRTAGKEEKSVNALYRTKILEFITKTRKNTQNVNKSGRWKVRKRAVVKVYRKK